MNIKLPGDKTEAACETCKRFAEATWRYGPFEMKDGAVVKDVMQAYCDACGESLLIAQQSVYKIKETRESERKVRTSVNLTAPLRDFAFSLVFQKGAEPERGPELILRVFLTDLIRHPDRISEAIEQLRSVDKRLLRGRKDQKVDVSFPSDMFTTLDTLAQKTGFKRSEVMRRALWASHQRPQLESDIKKIVDSRRTSVV